jgi:hypothetical protein
MPAALHLDVDGRVTAWDRSRSPAATDPGWVNCTPEQLVQAQALRYPRWDGREVVDVPPTLAEVQAARTAEIIADCDARLDRRWPMTDRLAVTLGVPLVAGPAIAADVAAHLKARDVALAELALAKDSKQAEAVAAPWPADLATKERAKLDQTAWDAAHP